MRKYIRQNQQAKEKAVNRERLSLEAQLPMSELISGVREDIEAFASVHLGPGTLYGAIARLETQGLIEPLPAEERRRPYRLTAAGIALLQEQLTGLETFPSMGLQRLANR